MKFGKARRATSKLGCKVIVPFAGFSRGVLLRLAVRPAQQPLALPLLLPPGGGGHPLLPLPPSTPAHQAGRRLPQHDPAYPHHRRPRRPHTHRSRLLDPPGPSPLALPSPACRGKALALCSLGVEFV